ncbi:MAG: DEAD/DEAH box helicase family protein [Betaproteobacteria bacterium]|nr:DEAD/DEAH box helicase family protein [Betaproteobacteria bacterium]
MGLELKSYQRKAIEVLARFFDLARGAGDYGGLDAAFRQVLGEQGCAWDAIPQYLAQGFEVTPYVCLRIPTGGGKTLLGAHAIACAARHYTGQDRPLALWLVPTNTIRQQTLNALRQPGHPYREALEQHFGVDGPRVIDITECEQLRPQDFENRAIVVVGTLQTLRVEETSGRDVYAYKEAFEPHFARAPDLRGFERVVEADLAAQPYLARADIGKVKRSFANLMYWHRPVVIIDEAHNARGALSFETFARLRPAALIEMTATPVRKGSQRSNVLYHVSAEALKAEQMIKLPIVLQAHPNWQEAVRDALLTRKRLAVEAVNEDQYLRPILMLQAEDKSGEITVERLRTHLIEQEHIAAPRIAVATGNQRELDGVNLFDPKCPVEIVITVEALKEGWDCSFAYVFCSLQRIGSSKDMEQLLGRVLRMPYASRRRSDLLNRAYAHLASGKSAEVANALADRLVAMGFEELEAAQAIYPSTAPLFDESGAVRALTTPPLEFELPVAPRISPELAQAQGVSWEARPGGAFLVRLSQPPTVEVRETLIATLLGKKEQEQVAKQMARFELVHLALHAPSERGIPFRPLPLLCVQFAWGEQAELELASRESLADLAGVALAEQGPELPGFTPDRDAKPYLLDIEQGHLRIEQDQREFGMNLDLVPGDVEEGDLLRWLDARLRTPNIAQAERLVWLGRVLRHLQREGQYSLTALVRHRNQLADSIAERIAALASRAQGRGFQLALLGDQPRACVSDTQLFRFAPGGYPAQPPFYQDSGRYRFQRHYYGVIGELEDPPRGQTDHEFHCAVAIDRHPAVRHWVRNLAKTDLSFRLPTAGMYFYPDFICELLDGRHLVVEYKGEGYKSSNESNDKRLVGEFWAKASRNLFLMAVERDGNGRGVYEQIDVLIGGGATSVRFAEHERVRLRGSVASEGYALSAGALGTILAVYGDGAAYAVEFGDLNGEIAVVTVAADALEAAVLR